jgi:hypothetical protein
MPLSGAGDDSNKMKKLHERLITVAGIAVLVAIFCYQVAYGETAIIVHRVAASGTIGPNGTMTITQGNMSATFGAPPGTTVSNVTMRAESTPTNLPPVTINFTDVLSPQGRCVICIVGAFDIFDPSSRMHYKGYNEWPGLITGAGPVGQVGLLMCAHKKDSTPLGPTELPIPISAYKMDLKSWFSRLCRQEGNPSCILMLDDFRL